MKIFVIGGTGFISGALVRQLLDDGHDVTVFNRGRSGKILRGPPGLTVRHGDRHDRSALEEAASQGSFDAVFDMIAYTPAESSLAEQVFRDRADRFIHCSTISVYMISDEARCPVTEDQDKLPVMDFWPRNPFGMQYGIDKRKCEDVLWEAHEAGHHRVSMIRPPYVCGPGDPTIRDYFWIERILDGGPLLVPGDGEDEFQVVYVEDVARAFALLLDHRESIGKPYNVAGEEVHTLDSYILSQAEILGREVELVHIPQDEFDQLDFSTYPGADVFPFNTRRDAVFSLKRVRADLGYQSTPFEEWMLATIDWYVGQEGLRSHGYERRSAELAHIADQER